MNVHDTGETRALELKKQGPRFSLEGHDKERVYCGGKTGLMVPRFGQYKDIETKNC
jgi:hypothetical protein